MNTIKKIITAITPRGSGIGKGALEAAFYFGIVEFVFIERFVAINGFTFSIWLAEIACLWLIIISLNYIAGGIQAAQAGNRYNEYQIKHLEAQLNALKDEVFKKCDCGLAWGHTGRHAPHANHLRGPAAEK